MTSVPQLLKEKHKGSWNVKLNIDHKVTMLNHNWQAFLLTAFLSVVWLRLVDFIAHKGWIDSPLSRKIIHIGTGPIFVLCWLFFNPAPGARFLAAIIPLMITVQFALIGFGVIKDQASVDSMSRSGDPKEILRGPLYYGIVFVILTLVFWKDSPVGIIALMMLCGGDGMADLIGKRYGKVKLPWSPEKSVAGTMAVFVAGFLLSLFVFGIYSLLDGGFQPFGQHIMPVFVISLVASLVESLPFHDIDNITVPGVSVLLGLLLYSL